MRTHSPVDGWFYAPSMRRAHEQGNMAFIPNHLHLAATKWLYRNKPNIYVGAASMPDKNGYISLSTSNTYERRMMEAADITILEINPNYPFVYGDHVVHCSEVDYLVEAGYPVPIVPDAPSNEKDMSIGRLIAGYVPDGACIQLGIGGIPNAVAEFLKEKNDLGVHTELITSGMAELVKMGVITNKRKQINRGQMVATMILGTQELYDFVDHNQGVALYDGAWVNDPYVIAQNDNQISINTSLEVDLTGQCASESIGSRQFSGTGGPVRHGGRRADVQGRTLHHRALLHRHGEGQRPPARDMRSPRSSPSSSAALRSASRGTTWTSSSPSTARPTCAAPTSGQRVEALINIAHPKFRDELWDQALACGIIGKR